MKEFLCAEEIHGGIGLDTEFVPRQEVTRCMWCASNVGSPHNPRCEKMNGEPRPPEWFCADSRKRIHPNEMIVRAMHHDLNTCPLDTAVVLADEYYNLYVGTLTMNGTRLTRGECIHGDAEQFYRNRIIGWEPYDPR